jgi:acetylornithine deacetylase/succinyl-diaminopimelate desuccinylase-like protein
MAIPSWPSSNNFPQVPQKGFTESVGINILRSATDAGPAKQRVRGRRPSTMQLSFIMTDQHAEMLETFVKDTIRGTKRFNFLHPRTKGTVEVRIVPQQDGEFFQLQYLAPGYWQTQINFEILP